MAKQNIQKGTKQRVQKGRKSRAAMKRRKVVWDFPLNKQNFMYLAVALGVIIIGYVLMATGITEEPALPDGKWNNPMAVTIAPILLFIGYVIIIPLGIYKYFGKDSEKQTKKEN
jgi:uncharacterized membrane protein